MRLLTWLDTTPSRSIVVALVGALVAGLIATSFGRVAMRLIAMAGGDSLDFLNFRFTLEGTLAIMSITIQAIPGALMLLAIRKWLPGSGNMRIAAYGLAVLVFPGTPLLLVLDEFHMNGVNATLGRALFALCFFAYGAILGWIIEKFDPVRPPDATKRRLPPPLGSPPLAR